MGTVPPVPLIALLVLFLGCITIAEARQSQHQQQGLPLATISATTEANEFIQSLPATDVDALIEALPFVPTLAATEGANDKELLEPCNSDDQLVGCTSLAVNPSELRAIRNTCCRSFSLRDQLLKDVPQPARVHVPRHDLDPSATSGTAPDWLFNCVAKETAKIPVFLEGQEVKVMDQTVPALTSNQIRRVKAAAMQRAKGMNPRLMQQAKAGTGKADERFNHPAALASAAELALLQWRIEHKHELQTAALHSLLTGHGVPPRIYYSPAGLWHPATDTPLKYDGPYPVRDLQIGYGGYQKNDTCPLNYPVQAFRPQCGHLAFVEMDAQMSYKQALAFFATKNSSYAQNAYSIINAWSTTNKKWGTSNGPLEAAWGIAAFAKSLELLRAAGESSRDWKQARANFISWYKSTLHGQIVGLVNAAAARARLTGTRPRYNNWHASITEGWMAIAILTDDTKLFDQAVQLFRNTTASYYQVGREDGHIIGECSETLRDIEHAQFGLGGLLQTAELAWQQDLDLYKADGYALAAAMEFMARIINAYDAGKDESLLPPHFKFFRKSIPAPPEGSDWVYNLGTHTWYSRNRRTMSTVSQLNDGNNYLVSIKYLPAGWELGYNHYVGRLGMKLPETAKLLQQYSVDWAMFHWGLGTLTHANTASVLWRPGVTKEALC